jgi:hypothetical protein
MGFYVDEFNTNPATVLGGELWNNMNWLRLFFIALISVLSGIKLFSNKK